MNPGEWFRQLRDRMRSGGKQLQQGGVRAGQAMKTLLDSFSDEWIEQAFRLARQKRAPELEQLPIDFKLRESAFPRRIYERLFPVAYVMRLGYRYDAEHLEDYMPISPDSYIGRGSYKFVYKLPWQMVVKVSKEIMPSDPICGSLFREVYDRRERFLAAEELDLMDALCRRRRGYRREKMQFKFFRLGMERYHYWKVREALPDLVLPTRFFMGVRFRRSFLGGERYSRNITPMDSQIMLVGKHLKEFATSGKRSEQGLFGGRLFPRYDFQFDIGRFGRIKRKILIKIAEDFRRLIDYTERLAQEEKLILDIHTENLIITLPDFQLKVFDFHLFDEHLYDPAMQTERPEQDHIEVIEKFIESFELENELER